MPTQNASHIGSFLQKKRYLTVLLMLSVAVGCGRDSKAQPSSQPSAHHVASSSLPSSRPTVRYESVRVNADRHPSISAPSPSKPLAPVRAENATVPAWQPLRDAVIGEWAEYGTLDGLTLRYTVMGRSITAVSTRVTMRKNGRAWGEPAIREDALDVDCLAKQAKSHETVRTAAPATIDAAGQRWKTILYEDRWTDEEIPYLRRTWVSTEVPFEGVVRMELYGANELEARLSLRATGKPIAE